MEKKIEKTDLGGACILTVELEKNVFTLLLNCKMLWIKA